MKNKIIRRGDIILALAALAAALILLIFQRTSSGGRVAVVTVNSEVIARINLDELSERTVIKTDTEPSAVIVAENGEIYFESSGCKDKICVKTGRLTHKGDTAVCLPARAVVSISGSDVDAITY